MKLTQTIPKTKTECSNQPVGRVVAYYQCEYCGHRTEHHSVTKNGWETATCKKCGTAKTYRVA